LLDLLEQLLNHNQPLPAGEPANESAAADAGAAPDLATPTANTAGEIGKDAAPVPPDNAIAAYFQGKADQAAAVQQLGSKLGNTPPDLLRKVVQVLKQLQQAEASGAAPDAALIKKAKKAIDDLLAFLNQQQQPQAAINPLAAPLAPAGPIDPTLPAQGAGAAPPVGAIGDQSAGPPAIVPSHDPDAGTDAGDAKAAQIATARTALAGLSSKLDQLAQGAGKIDPDLAAKLDALAKSLDPAQLSDATVRQLGLATDDGTPPDPRLATAINGLVNGKPQSSQAAQPTLATPQLKLPDNSALVGSAGDKGPGTQVSLHARPTPADHPGKSDATTDDAKPAGAVADPQSKPKPAPDGQGASSSSATQSADTGPSAPAGAGPLPATVPVSAATTRQAQAIYQNAPAAMINLPQMAFEVVRHMQQGQNHFQIRLDPADMGRVDVKLAIDGSGAVSARLTVERPETLDLLRRDAGQLGQALSQAGLDGSKTNLQFSLSQNPFSRPDGQGGRQPDPGYAGRNASDEEGDAVAAVAAPSTVLYRGTATTSGLNLIV
jgi:flagellar hook-length control protein FliK